MAEPGEQIALLRSMRCSAKCLTRLLHCVVGVVGRDRGINNRSKTRNLCHSAVRTKVRKE